MCYKSSFHPQLVSDRTDGIGERSMRFALPLYAEITMPYIGQTGVQQCDHRVQSEQTQSNTQYRVSRSTTDGLQAQVCTHFLKCDLDQPAASKCFDDLLGCQREIGSEEVFLAVCARAVVAEHLTYEHQPFAAFVSLSCTGNHSHFSSAAAVSSYFQPLALGFRHHKSGRWLCPSANAQTGVAYCVGFATK
jgi:hypothetical protein